MPINLRTSIAIFMLLTLGACAGVGARSGDGDITAPIASLTAATVGNNANVTVASSKSGTAYLVKADVPVHSVKDITNAADDKWKSRAIVDWGEMSVSGLRPGVYRLYVEDIAGNLSSMADKTIVVTNTPDGNRIDLGSLGNLIAPVYVDGNWYFFLDRNGDGIANRWDDSTTHEVLDEIFNHDINGNTNLASVTTNTYRYATVNGVHIALPTSGDNESMARGEYRLGTATLGSGYNPTYNDLMAIWDAYNGISTDFILSGVPSGWCSRSSYLSATPSSLDGLHFKVGLDNGTVSDESGGDAAYGCVALQVL